jgi:hypothetical protein
MLPDGSLGRLLVASLCGKFFGWRLSFSCVLQSISFASLCGIKMFMLWFIASRMYLMHTEQRLTTFYSLVGHDSVQDMNFGSQPVET